MFNVYFAAQRTPYRIYPRNVGIRIKFTRNVNVHFNIYQRSHFIIRGCKTNESLTIAARCVRLAGTCRHFFAVNNRRCYLNVSNKDAVRSNFAVSMIVSTCNIALTFVVRFQSNRNGIPRINRRNLSRVKPNELAIFRRVYISRHIVEETYLTLFKCSRRITANVHRYRKRRVGIFFAEGKFGRFICLPRTDSACGSRIFHFVFSISYFYLFPNFFKGNIVDIDYVILSKLPCVLQNQNVAISVFNVVDFNLRPFAKRNVFRCDETCSFITSVAPLFFPFYGRKIACREISFIAFNRFYIYPIGNFLNGQIPYIVCVFFSCISDKVDLFGLRCIITQRVTAFAVILFVGNADTVFLYGELCDSVIEGIDFVFVDVIRTNFHQHIAPVGLSIVNCFKLNVVFARFGNSRICNNVIPFFAAFNVFFHFFAVNPKVVRIKRNTVLYRPID